MKSSMIFSIIIPAKNEENYIDKCLDGVNNLNLNKSKYEVIVVDNGSVDKTIEISKSKGAYVLNVTGGTIGLLRNEGAKMAKGTYLAFLDADCIADTNWLKNALDQLANLSVASVGSKPNLPENGTTWVERTWSLIKQKPELSDVKWLSSCNVIVRKSVFDSVHGFDETLATCEDADLGYKISLNHRIVNDPRVSVIHLREPKTITDFVKKEIWHGVGNYKGVFKHGIVMQEIPSLLMPIWVLLWNAIFIVSLVFLFTNVAIFSLFASLIPASIQTARTLIRIKSPAKFGSIFILYVLYYLSRGIAIFRGDKKGGFCLKKRAK